MYLDACTRSRGAGLLNSSVDGYDATAARKEGPTLRVERLRDPTHFSAQKEQEERQAVGQPLRAPAGSRQVLDPQLWLTGKIESTPHGRTVPTRPGARKQTTQIAMDDFHPPVRAAPPSCAKTSPSWYPGARPS